MLEQVRGLDYLIMFPIEKPSSGRLVSHKIKASDDQPAGNKFQQCKPWFAHSLCSHVWILVPGGQADAVSLITVVASLLISAVGTADEENIGNLPI